MLSDLNIRRGLRLSLGALLLGCFEGEVSAADDVPNKPVEKPGDWVVLPADGTPWLDEATGLRFPQHLGAFRLRLGFRDRNKAAGLALSYVHGGKNIRGDVVVAPVSEDLNKVKDVMAFLHREHDKLVSDLQVASKEQGYREISRTPVEERAVNLWQGNLPLTVQSFEFGPSAAQDELVKPRTSQWFGVALYQDHFVQMSIVRPASSGAEGEQLRNELVKLFLQCIREPSVTPEMLKLCRTYIDAPMTKQGRDAADALHEYSQTSPVFKIQYPGEVLTASLDAASAVSKEAALDLLRGFIVGSGVAALQGGTADQSLEEGARIMMQIYGLLKKQNEKLKSDFLEQLLPLVEKERAATFLRQKMAEDPKVK